MKNKSFAALTLALLSTLNPQLSTLLAQGTAFTYQGRLNNNGAVANAPSSRHVGPMAQDFRASFGIGPDDKHIATVNESGVALAATQGLNQKMDSENAKLREGLNRRDAENAELKQRLDALEKIIHHQKSN